jgi:hypothetical protein
MAPPDEYRMQAPAAFYVSGPPTLAAERLSTKFLDRRPGALIVVASAAVKAERRD